MSVNCFNRVANLLQDICSHPSTAHYNQTVHHSRHISSGNLCTAPSHRAPACSVFLPCSTSTFRNLACSILLQCLDTQTYHYRIRCSLERVAPCAAKWQSKHRAALPFDNWKKVQKNILQQLQSQCAMALSVKLNIISSYWKGHRQKISRQSQHA